MSRIRQLSPSVINKIAAGEVIERPASAVKELLENSVDALATRIDVDIVDGGSELIRVTDDGEGIHPDDVLLAVTAHATSKLADADDLFRVHTLGFRGEALASMAEVSHFSLRTRQAEQDAGVELEVNGGVIEPLRTCGCPVGTSIEIKQLFFNTPVRRKFLKSSSTELSHICEQFTRIALANPRLHLVLRHNDKPIYELPATDSLLERLRTFYGEPLAKQLIWVESQHEGARLWGYVAHPSQNKPTRKSQYLFLNGRWIQDRTLQQALVEAYRGLLMVGRYPITFLFLELPADQVDVNVHPTKSEVRFRDNQFLFRLVLSALRSKFLELDLANPMRLPESEALPASNEETPLSTNVDHQRKLALDYELADWAKSQLEQVRQQMEAGGELPPRTYPEPSFDSEPASSELDTPTFRLPGSVAPFQPFPALPKSFDEYFPTPSAAPSELPQTQPEPQPVRLAQPLQYRAMQVHDCYIVLETEDGLSVIDQHALHERIMYEHLRNRVLAGHVESQRLLVPEPVELAPAEVAMLLEQAPTLARFGLEIEEFGGNTVVLTRYPVMLGRVNRRDLVRDIANQLAEQGQLPSRRDLLDELLHMMSCKAAVKAGQRLSAEEIDGLLSQRHLIDDAHHCPHGRPTALNLSRMELDKQFGRLGA